MEQLKEEFEEKFLYQKRHFAYDVRTPDDKFHINSEDIWEWVEEKLKEKDKQITTLESVNDRIYDKAIDDAIGVCSFQLGELQQFKESNPVAEGGKSAIGITIMELEKLKK